MKCQNWSVILKKNKLYSVFLFFSICWTYLLLHVNIFVDIYNFIKYLRWNHFINIYLLDILSISHNTFKYQLTFNTNTNYLLNILCTFNTKYLIIFTNLQPDEHLHNLLNIFDLYFFSSHKKDKNKPTILIHMYIYIYIYIFTNI